MNERCTIDGSIASVIYQNEENGYTVLRLVTGDGEAVTVVGAIPCAAPGEDLIVTGRWVNHPVHGDQVEAQQVERHMPTTEDEIYNYLASGIIKGVGPSTANSIVQAFGADSLIVME
ncbi:MAG: ATP-dependent RecD-like DNA helicase, partial [Oscillospiraceae bacterium]|nr:ATP-dependent RecD-like DNA helicase [Oscillospiraceae bacterium]